MNDKELRELISKHPSNGSYAITICRTCHHFLAKPDGDVNTAIIVETCEDCLHNRKAIERKTQC